MRCPNGTRKNKKGECVKYTGAKNANTNKTRNAKTNIILENVNKSKLKKVLELCSKENIKYTFDNSSKMSPSPKVNYRKILKDKIKIMIKNDLTIGRSDEDLEPFTSDQINTFMKENYDNIEQVITTIITEYTNDNELETLQHAKYSWIGEYLYQVVDTTGD